MTQDINIIVAGLSTEQKLEVIREARSILGQGGRNWIKRSWYAKRLQPGTKINKACSLKEADCFCLEGAVNKALLNLGYVTYTRAARLRSAPARLISLKSIVKTLGFQTVHGLNDHKKTTWRTIKKVLDTREAELVAELEKEDAAA